MFDLEQARMWPWMQWENGPNMEVCVQLISLYTKYHPNDYTNHYPSDPFFCLGEII